MLFCFDCKTMKCLWLSFVLFLSVNCEEDDFYLPRLAYPEILSINNNAEEPVWDTVEQKLDHFNDTDNRTWIMNYLYNRQFYIANGPILLLIGGENQIDPIMLKTGQIFDIAEKNKGLLVLAPHRFYGNNRPTSDLTIENLKYLTVDQVLADIVELINYLKRSYAYSKVIVFGGSYPGNLAIWLRQKYPSVIYAAVASSAPVLAKADFYEYNEVVAKVLGLKCSSIISKAFNLIKSLLNTANASTTFQKDFNLCEPLNVNDSLEVMYLFSIITSYFGGLVQYNNGYYVSYVCNSLNNSTENEYKALTNFLNAELGVKCKKNYSDMKKFFSNPYNNNTNKRQWFYQTCTHLGYFQTTTSKNQPYGDVQPMSMYHTWCKDFFGYKFPAATLETGVSETNLKYGGKTPKVTRVIMVYGTADPWFKLGINKQLGPSNPLIVINGTSHCKDVDSISIHDSPELREAKLSVQKYVKEWLADETEN